MPSPLTTEDVQAAAGNASPPAGSTPEPSPDGSAAPDQQTTRPTDYSGPGGGGSHPAAMLETLPPDLLDNPLTFAISKGQPAAVSAPGNSKDPYVKSVEKHAQAMVAAGFGIYHSQDKKTYVLFNTQIVHPYDLGVADKAGKLLDIAPPFDKVQLQTPAAGAQATPSGGAGAAPIAGASVPASQPAASVQNKLAAIRGKNLSPMSPTGGAAPGAGGILNSILRPAV
jgi:hypothetical protein